MATHIRTGHKRAGIVASAILGLASPAAAECTLSISGPGANAHLGAISAGTAATTYTVPASGTVTQSPGGFGTGASVLLRPPADFHLSVEIVGGSTCPNNLTVTLSALSSHFVTSSTTFAVTNFQGMNAVSLTSGQTLANGDSFSFTFADGGLQGTARFDVGLTIALPPSPASGAAQWTTHVSVAG